jgi:hypothetical protein
LQAKRASGLLPPACREGTGPGPVIRKHLVGMHGGQMAVSGKTGKGNIVSFVIPSRYHPFKLLLPGHGSQIRLFRRWRAVGDESFTPVRNTHSSIPEIGR